MAALNLTAAELEMCRRLGADPDAYARTKAELTAVVAPRKWRPGDPPFDSPTEEQMSYFVQAAVGAARPSTVATATASMHGLVKLPNGDMIVALHPIGLSPLFDD